MTDFIARLENEIAAKQTALATLQTELSELETTARVYKRLQETQLGSNGILTQSEENSAAPSRLEQKSKSNQKKSAKDFVVEILAERGPMHYKEVAEEAIRRGFRSVQSNDSIAPRRTIMSVLYRTPETFEAKGRGLFALKK